MNSQNLPGGSPNFVYSLGLRDSLAMVLMEAKYDKRKLPKEAEHYKKNFGEHPSLDFHLT